MTGGNSPTTQNTQSQSRQASPLHAGQQQQLCQDGQPQQLRKKSKEIIHSGHFMVSDFEAEGRDDDDDELAIPVPEDAEDSAVLVGAVSVSSMNAAGDLAGSCSNQGSCSVTSIIRPKRTETISPGFTKDSGNWIQKNVIGATFSCEDLPMQAVEDFMIPAVTIDQSLTKLFQCMTLAYSSKLTSPRWKNFKGLRLQWKDKIRLNNLIWRCWHMQFIERRNTAVCQFASPLEVDQHNKPEAVVLEGKYWKRRLATVTAEYKKWRIFFKNQMMGRASKDLNDINMCGELEHLDWFAPRSNCSFNSGTGSLALDDDMFMDFSDTLFSSLSSNQPFPFPNPREIAKGAGLADFIQPGLIQLQPNLDDFMDTFEPLHDLLSGRLPPVEEEIVAVEDSIAGRTSDQLTHRRNDFQLHENSPYCASTSTTPVSAAAIVVTASSPQPLLNYFQMDQSSSSYLSNPQLGNSHRHLTNHQNTRPLPQYHQQSQEQLQQQPLVNESAFSHPRTMVVPSSQNSVFESNAPSLGSSHQLQQQPQLVQSTDGFTASGRYENAASHSGAFQRQNSGGSEHGFVVPTAQFQGKQRSRSRSGSGPNTPGNGSAAIFPHAATTSLSASQPSIGSSRANRTKPNGSSSSSSSPARLLSNSASAQEAGLPRSSRGVGRLRSSSDLQPIMPVPTAAVSTPATVVPRTILPDNSALLAHLLTSPNQIGTPSTTLVLTADSSATRIPIIFPLQNPDTTTTKLEKPLTLLPTTVNLEYSNDSRPYKQEPSPNVPMVEDLINQNTSRSRSSDGERTQYREHRRVCHINAEQKRRCNIKNGFDTLQSLLPGGGATSGSGNGSGSSASSHGKSSDVSKAAMLHRGAEFIRQLRQERQQQQEEMDQLKQNIETLNAAISGCQALLPANGAPVSRQRNNRMREMFDDWVRVRTLQNWKFWIFSILIQPLLESYSTALSAATYEDLWQNVLNWVDQYCSLIALRPVVFNSLRNLSKTTDIIANPSRLPAEATQAACNPDRTTAPNNLPSTT